VKAGCKALLFCYIRVRNLYIHVNSYRCCSGQKLLTVDDEVLDLTKHAARTIVSTLNKGDRLGIVTFSDEAEVYTLMKHKYCLGPRLIAFSNRLCRNLFQ
jgi:hypothetical protein